MVNDIESREYSLLKDFRVEIEEEEERTTFSLCFWVYLISSSTSFPATIIQQVHSDSVGSAPFLVLDEKKRMMLLPLLLLHKEAPDPENSTSWLEAPHASVEIEFPYEKWIHVGCEVSTDFVRLNIDGEIVGEKSLSSLINKDSPTSSFGKLALANIGGHCDSLQGYVHNVEVLPPALSIKDHWGKEVPLKLSIDNSSASEIEVGDDGVWSIVGGKASCRRNFSLDVVLLNASGQPVNKDVEVVASLLFADNGALVENTTDAEAPLLASYDGIEYASCERPSKMLQGRASFKLKISQLSSKCDNRLFRIRFHMLKSGSYPFFEEFSPPIRCISRGRNARGSSLMWKRSTSTFHPVNISQSSRVDEGSLELEHCSIYEARPYSSSKRVRSGHYKLSTTFETDPNLERPDEECNSHPWTVNQVENEFGRSLEGRPENLEEADDSLSDSESTEERNSPFKSIASGKSPISDVTIFKYSLSALTERSFMLKEIAMSASDNELSEFAHQVSLYSGCSHHRHQISIAKRLIEEGTKAWSLISQNNHYIRWENAVFEIEEYFMKIAHCSSRSLTQQDFELLRSIAGCQEYLAQENFEKMWCWLYPTDILDRLRVKMMPHGTGDRGWDVFSLEYDARVPLDTVFTESVMARYLKIFNFLWKLRRVEHGLIGAWKTMKPNCITSHSFNKLQQAVKLQLLSTLRRCQVLWVDMNHFVTNLQYYIMFEVLEVSWSNFLSEMEVAKDLDDLLAAHEKYLHSIVEKSLLGERSQTLCKSLFVLFDLILRFRSYADRLYEGIHELQARTMESSLPSRDKSKSRRQLGDKSSDPGSWIGEGRKALTQRAGEFLRNMGLDLDAIAKEYSSLLEGFISQLPVQQHVDLKFLLFRLDFTEFYTRSGPTL